MMQLIITSCNVSYREWSEILVSHTVLIVLVTIVIDYIEMWAIFLPSSILKMSN